jgi:DNA-directed RNA polymerase specialized sigma24 family protein
MLPKSSASVAIDDELAHSLWHLLFRAARRACRTEQDAEDAAQDEILNVLRRPGDRVLVVKERTTIQEGRLPGWLRARVQKAAIRLASRSNKVPLDRVLTQAEPDYLEDAEREPSAVELFCRSLRAPLRRITERLCESTQAEIGNELGVTPRTIRNWKREIKEQAHRAGLRPGWHATARCRGVRSS